MRTQTTLNRPEMLFLAVKDLVCGRPSSDWLSLFTPGTKMEQHWRSGARGMQGAQQGHPAIGKAGTQQGLGLQDCKGEAEVSAHPLLLSSCG